MVSERSCESRQRKHEILKSKINVTVLNKKQKKVWAEKLEPVKQSWLKKANSEEKALFDWVSSLR